MPIRAARNTNYTNVETLMFGFGSAAAIGFLETCVRSSRLSDILVWSPWSFKFNGNEENANRRLTPGGNSGTDRQQKQTGRFRRRV